MAIFDLRWSQKGHYRPLYERDLGAWVEKYQGIHGTVRIIIRVHTDPGCHQHHPLWFRALGDDRIARRLPGSLLRGRIARLLRAAPRPFFRLFRTFATAKNVGMGTRTVPTTLAVPALRGSMAPPEAANAAPLLKRVTATSSSSFAGVSRRTTWAVQSVAAVSYTHLTLPTNREV